jgi:nucleotide-binding universal stress UspA family protein
MNGEYGVIVAGVSPADYRLPMVRWAAAEAAARGAELRLVTAVPAPAAAEQYLPAGPADAVRAAGQDHLAAAAEQVTAEFPGLPVTTEVEAGRALDVLRDAGARADLLVVGADDQSPFAEAITGSVPGSLLTTAPCPLVIVPNAESGAGDGTGAPVVAALDDQGTSQAAVAYAFAAADRSGRPLVLLRCVPADRRATPTPPGHALMITAFRGLYPDVGVTEESTADDPSAALTQWSRRATLLVLGSRGRGRLTSTLFGSVGRMLIRRSGCPVVVARPGSVDLARGAV